MIQDLDRDELGIHMDARPEHVYEIVADVTRTPEFSPEVISCTWLDGATGPAVGARFKARNKVQRGPGWNNKPVVTVADPGHEFAFTRTEFGGGTMLWRYQFEPEGAGTRVTESYEMVRPMTKFMWFIIEGVCGRHDRRSDLRIGMQQTLDRVRVVAEKSKSIELGTARPLGTVSAVDAGCMSQGLPGRAVRAGVWLHGEWRAFPRATSREQTRRRNCPRGGSADLPPGGAALGKSRAHRWDDSAVELGT